MAKNIRILLGMSGGLDSTMSALLLKNAGYEVIGITLKTWHLSPKMHELDLEKASDLAGQMDIEHHILDISKVFKRKVVDYFCNEYLRGRTPNPCNRCNPLVKWPFLIEMADTFNCEHIATGHYVQKVEKNGVWYIKKGLDFSKDQSYFLWNLNQEVLRRAMFPLGKLNKADVRKLALKHGLHETANQPESMGVCFLDGTNYHDFLQQETSITTGDIVDEAGTILGQHPGIPFFTIGQKKGLGLSDKDYFVKQLDSKSNRIIVSKTASLATTSLLLNSFHLSRPLNRDEKADVAIRIRGIDKVPPIPGNIKKEFNGLRVNFYEPAWGITPGQSIVFYKDDLVIGGGIS
jgi:tRNA-uridine 2-sulfurtransferase